MMLSGLWARLRVADTSRVVRLGFAVVGTIVGTFVFCGIARIRINTSPSLPVGLYVLTDDLEAALVEFCPPEPYATLAIQRGYRTEGVCRDGGTPLLKPIVAREGDFVQISTSGIRVNGQLLRNSAPRSVDTSGRPMAVWPIHSQRVAADTVWVVSSYNPRSFDSRYFGPIPLLTVSARLSPLVVER
jgi:conjugative transfer signal peptidase TraF